MPYDEEEVPSQLRCMTILGSNAYHTLIGSTDINERRALLFYYLLVTRLLLCNRCNMLSVITRSRQEVLDITLLSEELLNRLTQWSFSDHSYIEYIEYIIEKNVDKIEFFRNHRKTNWRMPLQELNSVFLWFCHFNQRTKRT